MPLQQALRLSSILLAAASFAGLVLTAELSPWLASVGAASILVNVLRTLGVPVLRRISNITRMSAATWNILLVAAFAGFWIDFLWISEELLPAGMHFLVALMINKLFNLHQRRDYLHLYVISLMAILSSAALTNHVSYAPVFVAYLIAGVWTLLLYQLANDSEGTRSPHGVAGGAAGPAASAARITPRLFWMTNAAALGALTLTVLVFFSIPRIGTGLLHKGRGEGLRTSGFSDRVDLGVIGPVKQDPTIVMRVELPERAQPVPDRLYLRGNAYDRYNGRSWANTFTHRRVLGEVAPGTFRVGNTATSQSAGHGHAVMRHDILLEPLDTTVLFGAPFPRSISGELPAIHIDPAGALYLPHPSGTRVQYSVHSESHQVSVDERKARSLAYPEPIRRTYLQLPASLSSNVRSLAQRIAAQAESPYETALAIKQYLLLNYRYSLDIGSSVSARPLDDFLFRRKTGYCEHYATAMVVLLRSVGIPARLVTGFLASEWNDFGNHFTVRQKDAHAWVEVYYPESGWVTFDPTPSLGESAANEWWEVFSRLTDSARLRWDRLFVHYSAVDQLAVVKGLRESGDTLRTELSEMTLAALRPLGRVLSAIPPMFKRATRMQVWLVILLLAGSGTALFFLLRHAPWTISLGRPNFSQAKEALVSNLYRRITSLAESHGIPRSPATTPYELARSVRRHWTIAAPHVESLTSLYCRVRFGQATLSAADLADANCLLDQLRKLPRQP